MSKEDSNNKKLNVPEALDLLKKGLKDIQKQVENDCLELRKREREALAQEALKKNLKKDMAPVMPLNQDPGSAGLGGMTMAEPKMEKCSSPVMEALRKKGLHKNYTMKDHKNSNDPERHELFVRGGKPVVLPSDKPVKDVTATKDGSGGEISDNAPKKLGKAGMSMAPAMPKAPMAAKPSMTNKGGTPDGAGAMAKDEFGPEHTEVGKKKLGTATTQVKSPSDNFIPKPLMPQGQSEKEQISNVIRRHGSIKLPGYDLGKSELKKEHIGFDKLKNELAHKKGVSNPGAVAAAIGRKKYGAHKMAEAAHEGKPANKIKKSVIDLAKAELEKKAPPGWSEDTMRGLKREHGIESAFKIAWSAYNKTHGKKPKAYKTANSKKIKKDLPSMENFQSLVPKKPKPAPDLGGVNKELKGFKSLVKPGK